MTSSLKITELDFDTLKENLKTFLESQEEFKDYDFDSSALSTLLNLLAYNAYHDSFYLNMVGNEMFLESAVRRENVVSRAKEQGYLPRSVKGARSTLDVTINPDDSPQSITVEKNERFTTTIDEVEYVFVTSEPTTILANSTGGFQSNIEIVEGEPLTHRFTVDDANPIRYIVPNPDIDTDSIVVKVQESANDTTQTTKVLATDSTAINGNSDVYFLQEADGSKYEIYFGDDVLGRAVKNGNIVIVDYRVSNGPVTNGVDSFTAPSTLGGYSDFTYTVTEGAHSGSDRETIDSIKRNAPLSFEVQNRAVVSNDYEQIIKRNFGYIDSVNVWGGEDNDPPIYGRVFISAKRKQGSILSQTQKDDIVNALSTINTIPIGIRFIDPFFLYVNPEIRVFFNSRTATQSPGQIRNAVSQAVIDFESESLGTFDDKKFRYSRFLNDIEISSDSIVNALLTVTMSKKFVPDTTKSVNYRIDFGNPIKRPRSPGHTSHDGAHFIDSSEFTYQGKKSFFDDDGEGTLRIYTVTTTGVTYLERNAGTIDYDNGIVNIINIRIPSFKGTFLEIVAIPEENDISAIKNQIILVGDTTISVINEETEEIVAITTDVQTEGSSINVIETGIQSVIV